MCNAAHLTGELRFFIQIFQLTPSEMRKLSFTKAELLQEGTFFLIHFFAIDDLVMKKLEIKRLSPLLLHQF